MSSPIERRVLIIDDDDSTQAALRSPLLDAGLTIDTARDGLTAINKLSEQRYAAVVLSLIIRHGLNGFVVLNYIEQEQPEMLSRVFLFTALSKETIARTAPEIVGRFFKKPSEADALAAAVVAFRGAYPQTERKPNCAVLLVEDDAKTAGLQTEMLSELGYSCRWTSSGGDVLKPAQSPDFDVLMLDLLMPDVDGFRILQTLEATRPELLKRVIVVTGVPDRYLGAINPGQICGIVRKPVDSRELSILLAKCCRPALVPSTGGPQ